MTPTALQTVLDAIDRANAHDKNRTDDGAGPRPAELVYGERMTAMLTEFCTAPGDHLQIAARAQHIERWKSPRADYPSGRAGYLKWRNDLKAFHARRTGELMAQAGYEQSDIEQVEKLIAKRGLKRMSDAQALEDVACLVFLKYYAADFIAKHDDGKVIDILKKTARKMSADGMATAGRLELPDRLGRLLGEALTPPENA
jgi:hypothetical protein